MSDTVVQFPTPSRERPDALLSKQRDDALQLRQQLVARVRSAGASAKAAFSPKEDRVLVAQEVDQLIKMNGIKPPQIRKLYETKALSGPKLERMRVSSDLLRAEAKKQYEKGLVRTIQPFLQLLEALAELLHQESDDLIYRAFKDTSFGRSNARVENDAADDLSFLLHEMIRGVVSSEELEQYFKTICFASYDSTTREFSSVISAGVKSRDTTEIARTFGYEDDAEEIWSAPALPATPLLRVQRIKWSGPLRFERAVFAPKNRSADDVAHMIAPDGMDAVRWRTGRAEVLKPFGPVNIINSEVTLCQDVRLAIGPTTRFDNLGPLFEFRSFVELTVNGELHELSSPLSVHALAEPMIDSEIDWLVGSVAAKFGDGWHRVTGISPESWTGVTEAADAFGAIRDGGPTFEPLVEGFGGGHEFVIHWKPVNGETVGKLVEVFSKYLPLGNERRSNDKLSAYLLFETEGPYSRPQQFDFVNSACQDFEIALHSGALEEGLKKDCRDLKAKLDKRVREATAVRHQQRNALLARWRDMEKPRDDEAPE